MRLRPIYLLGVAVLVLAAAAGTWRSSRTSLDELKRQVTATERAFAATMKERDFDAFTGFLSHEAVFFSEQGALRGKAAVAQAWRRYYDQAEAPFSWEPEQVEVLDSGTLAYSGGPVYDAAGKRIGRFNSVWRLESPGVWRVVFDRGSDFCNCKR